MTLPSPEQTFPVSLNLSTVPAMSQARPPRHCPQAMRPRPPAATFAFEPPIAPRIEPPIATIWRMKPHSNQTRKLYVTLMGALIGAGLTGA